MKSHIEEEWKVYLRDVLKGLNPASVQAIECKRAFFAGASALYFLQMKHVSDGENVTKADEDFMKAISLEIHLFVAEVRAGVS